MGVIGLIGKQGTLSTNQILLLRLSVQWKSIFLHSLMGNKSEKVILYWQERSILHIQIHGYECMRDKRSISTNQGHRC